MTGYHLASSDTTITLDLAPGTLPSVRPPVWRYRLIAAPLSIPLILYWRLGPPPACITRTRRLSMLPVLNPAAWWLPLYATGAPDQLAADAPAPITYSQIHALMDDIDTRGHRRIIAPRRIIPAYPAPPLADIYIADYKVQQSPDAGGFVSGEYPASAVMHARPSPDSWVAPTAWLQWSDYPTLPSVWALTSSGDAPVQITAVSAIAGAPDVAVWPSSAWVPDAAGLWYRITDIAVTAA